MALSDLQKKTCQAIVNIFETEIDGKYGKDTAAAVEEFQKARGLKVDGEVGSTTWKALGLA